MSDGENIDHVLDQWPYDPDAVSVRLVKGDNDRDVIQMRIDMGLLQMETTGRPDGSTPHGFETYYDYLLAERLRDEDLVLSDDQCAGVDREFVQYYHRRICWLALREFGQAVTDANHTLALMDFSADHSPDEQWTMSHEQYRPFVMYHRIQASALAEVEDDSAETAIHHINEGLEDLREVFAEHEAEEMFDDDDLVVRLKELRESLRDHYSVGRTLHEQLEDAVAQEQYELAARLRDELARKNTGPHR